jgi:hypothetical protein
MPEGLPGDILVDAIRPCYRLDVSLYQIVRPLVCSVSRINSIDAAQFLAIGSAKI